MVMLCMFFYVGDGNEHFNHNQFVKKVIFTNVVFRIFEDLIRKVNKLKNLIAKIYFALGYLGRHAVTIEFVR